MPARLVGHVQVLLSAAFQGHQKGRLTDAVALYRRLLCIDPGHADGLHLLGVAAHQQGRNSDAVSLMSRAITVDAQVPPFHSNLGLALHALAQWTPAVVAFHVAVVLSPDFADAYNNLGISLKDEGSLGAAVISYERASALRPSFAEAHNNLGNALQEQGEADQAARAFERALAWRPGYADAAMNLALTQLYRPTVDLAEVLERARQFSAVHASTIDRLPAPSIESADRRPRIGFVSADFRQHAVGFLVIPAIEGLARAGYHVTCYSNSPLADRLTSRFVKAAAAWRSIVGLADEAVAAMIQADRIDILIDLSGYSAGNRLLVFARKPAPVQIACWVGYPATSGLAAMDYILADRYQIEVGAEPSYSEAVVRLPDSYIVFEPPAEAPPVAPLPALSRDGITFGSFNVLKKVTPDVVAVWSRILQRVPSSRLLVKARALNCASTRAHLVGLFAQQGVRGSQLVLRGGTTPEQHMACMQEADIALDSFPYAGGRTTLEALWMGLPVITWPQQTFASRHSLSSLSTIGLTEWVADSEARYIDLAVGWARDPARLARLRAGLREKIRCSPLCDVDKFTRGLTVALTTMWSRWLDGQKPTAFDVTDDRQAPIGWP